MARSLRLLAAIAVVAGLLSVPALSAPAAWAHHGSDRDDSSAYDWACHENPGGRKCVCYKALADDGAADNPDARIRIWDDGSCALKYLHLNLNTLWKFAALLGGALASISIGWAGFVLMQDTASGEGQSKAREMLFRVGIGLLALAFGAVFLEAVYLYLFGITDFWFGNDGEYFRRGGGLEILGFQ